MTRRKRGDQASEGEGVGKDALADDPDVCNECAGRVEAMPEEPDLGDLVVVLLASSLAGLRDRLFCDGYGSAAELVGDLVENADDYLMAMASIKDEHDCAREPRPAPRDI